MASGSHRKKIAAIKGAVYIWKTEIKRNRSGLIY